LVLTPVCKRASPYNLIFVLRWLNKGAWTGYVGCCTDTRRGEDQVNVSDVNIKIHLEIACEDVHLTEWAQYSSFEVRKIRFFAIPITVAIALGKCT
jgi:hypothetical protein